MYVYIYIYIYTHVNNIIASRKGYALGYRRVCMRCDVIRYDTIACATSRSTETISAPLAVQRLSRLAPRLRLQALYIYI